MIRWLRIASVFALALSLIALGVGVGLFLVANSGWVAVEVHPWLAAIVGDGAYDLWLPALLAGWLASILAVVVLLGWGVFYVWRRRQYERLIGKLEGELARLRNLSFTDPAPLEDLEDLDEQPDSKLGRYLEGDHGAEAGRP